MGAPATAPRATSRRALQRHETRERIYEAAVDEIARSGLGAADVGAIVAAAGVARGTFYFHFPTKEHVLAELEVREETSIVAGLERLALPADDPSAVFAAVVRRVRAAERRLGPSLFRDMLVDPLQPGRVRRWPGGRASPRDLHRRCDAEGPASGPRRDHGRCR